MEKTVLIVDDEEDILSLLEKTLDKSGFKALSSTSAIEALVMLQDNLVSVLITDVRMPGMDGLSLIQQAHEIKPDVPIIVMTGYGDYDTAIEALDRGAFYFINKPFNMKTIVDAVLKGVRLPRPLKNGNQVIPPGTHTLAFSVPPDMRMVQGVSYHASSAAMNMGYSKRCYSLELPFTINELLSKYVFFDSVKDKSSLLDVKIEISLDKIVIEAQCQSNVFLPENYPPPLEEIEFANEEVLGMMMARYFSDEMRFSDDGAGAVVTIRKERNKTGGGAG